MFSQRYILKKRNRYKFLKASMNEKRLPFTDEKSRRKYRTFLRNVLHIKSKLCGLTYEFINKDVPFYDEPVIYAVTHIGKYDWEMLAEAYDAFCYPIAGDWELMYGTVDDYFLRLWGVIYIDTGDKEDRRNTYKTIVNTLKRGTSILLFPEGIWNVTRHLPVMKIFPGAVKAAKECKIPIVPIGMEQQGKHFYINIGEKLDITTLEEKVALEKLRDRLATLKWQIWEQLPSEKRQDIPDDYYQRFIKARLAEWPVCTMELINCRIYRDYADKELASIQKDLQNLKDQKK